MLNVKPFDQKSDFCGPASLKMVLDYFGIEKTEKELAKLTGTTNAEFRGAEAETLLKVAKKFGFKGFIKDFAELKDIKHYVIKKKIPVIVDYFSKDDGHYSVAVDINKENIYFQDPAIGQLLAIRLKVFKRIWFDFPGAFLRSKDDIIIRRMIVIYK